MQPLKETALGSGMLSPLLSVRNGDVPVSLLGLRLHFGPNVLGGGRACVGTGLPVPSHPLVLGV